MSFRPYDHLERLDHSDVEGIDLGIVHIFPKIDGTNACMWWADGRLRCGSRNRECTVEADNQGFAAWAHSDHPVAISLQQFLHDHPHLIVYGEWMVPHTIKTYRTEAWRRFWIFDVYDREAHAYVDFDIYSPRMRGQLGLDLVLPTCTIENPSKNQMLGLLETNTFLMQDGAGPGEGIVMKNYTWRNRFGRQPWAKLVRAAFKEANRASFGSPAMKGEKQVEVEIVNELVTPELVGKTRAKVLIDLANKNGIDLMEPNAGKLLEEGNRHIVIPQLLGRVFHDLVIEETWAMIKKHKNPTIDYSRLQGLCIKRTKELAVDLFGG